VIWLALPALAAAAYYAAGDRIGRALAPVYRPAGAGNWTPPLSVLKPVHGRDPRFYEAILSHAAQDYPEFELLFGLTNPADPAIADIERLQREFPGAAIEIVMVETDAPNAKVGVLAELARRARHELLLVNDSDIVVEPGYFRTVVAPLDDPGSAW
jgi:ceramide glucosyltransferase